MLDDSSDVGTYEWRKDTLQNVGALQHSSSKLLKLLILISYN